MRTHLSGSNNNLPTPEDLGISFQDIGGLRQKEGLADAEQFQLLANTKENELGTLRESAQMMYEIAADLQQTVDEFRAAKEAGVRLAKENHADLNDETMYALTGSQLRFLLSQNPMEQPDVRQLEGQHKTMDDAIPELAYDQLLGLVNGSFGGTIPQKVMVLSADLLKLVSNTTQLGSTQIKLQPVWEKPPVYTVMISSDAEEELKELKQKYDELSARLHWQSQQPLYQSKHESPCDDILISSVTSLEQIAGRQNQLTNETPLRIPASTLQQYIQKMQQRQTKLEEEIQLFQNRQGIVSLAQLESIADYNIDYTISGACVCFMQGELNKLKSQVSSVSQYGFQRVPEAAQQSPAKQDPSQNQQLVTQTTSTPKTVHLLSSALRKPSQLQLSSNFNAAATKQAAPKPSPTRQQDILKLIQTPALPSHKWTQYPKRPAEERFIAKFISFQPTREITEPPSTEQLARLRKIMSNPNILRLLIDDPDIELVDFSHVFTDHMLNRATVVALLRGYSTLHIDAGLAKPVLLWLLQNNRGITADSVATYRLVGQ